MSVAGKHLLLLDYLELDLDLHSVLLVPESELEGLPVDDDAVDEAGLDVAGHWLNQLACCLDLPNQRVSTWGLPLQTHVRPGNYNCQCQEEMVVAMERDRERIKLRLVGMVCWLTDER